MTELTQNYHSLVLKIEQKLDNLIEEKINDRSICFKFIKLSIDNFAEEIKSPKINRSNNHSKSFSSSNIKSPKTNRFNNHNKSFSNSKD